MWLVVSKGIPGYACYCASYTGQVPIEKRFTISEVAADWRELTI